MQAAIPPNTISEMLPEEIKDKAPEFIDILNQFFTQTISETDLITKLEKLLENMPNSEEIISEIIRAVQPKPSVLPAPFSTKLMAPMRKKSRHWTPEEDQRLIEAINQKGTDNWSQIAKSVGEGRTQAQCSQRWHRVLDPKIDKGNWSKEEEEQLIEYVVSFGTKAWTKIAAKMGNRSDVQCRFRYNFILKKAGNKPEQIAPIALPHALLVKSQNGSNGDDHNSGTNEGIDDSFHLPE